LGHRIANAYDNDWRIREARKAGESMRAIAARLGVAVNTVLKVSRGPFESVVAA
jgi:hypothetical protein